MAYSELIKNFDRIRDYMRQFYVYGFKSRAEYDKKSARSYDNERRRVESWLGDFMRFRQTPDGKNVFLSVDSRSIPGNPLYNAFKAKSFTAGDVTFITFFDFVVASSVQVAPERVFACWGKPQSPRSALRAYLRIFQMLYFDRGRKVKSHRSPSNRGLWDSDLLQ